jgi:PTH1 family peptidyl-tRNA hydrolase
MRIVVGLGNPGREYVATRHNIGFMVVDELARRGGGGFRKRFKSELGETFLAGSKLVLVKPQTFMNLSGHAVREVLAWYHAPVDALLIVLDDLDLPFGTLRMRGRGSAGGHNGLASIVEQIGHNEVPRLRIGIGRGRSSASARVLSRFSSEEERELPDSIAAAADAVEWWVDQGLVAAMNRVNSPKPVGDERKPAAPSSPSPAAGL